MSESQGPTGPQFHADRPLEREAVRTTIVGGRPPGSGQSLGNIPRGVEVLIKKASVDPAFRDLLLTRRAEAAEEIGLQLDPAEAMMLAAATREQLESVIARTNVPEEHRRVFLGKAAAAMLALLGVTAMVGLVSSAGVRARRAATKGIQPDRPAVEGVRPDKPSEETRPTDDIDTQKTQPDHLPPEGARPDRAPEKSEPVSRGARPDRPVEKPKSVDEK
jgi:hypothetical protein